MAQKGLGEGWSHATALKGLGATALGAWTGGLAGPRGRTMALGPWAVGSAGSRAMRRLWGAGRGAGRAPELRDGSETLERGRVGPRAPQQLWGLKRGAGRAPERRDGSGAWGEGLGRP